MTHPSATPGYANINGLRLYYETYGEGAPLVLLHGGLRTAALLEELATKLATHRQVIAVDLQGHGRTADIDRPLRYERMADDIAALLSHLGLPKADLLGYSFGGGVALRVAIQYPALVRRLAVTATTFSQSGWYPEVVAAMKQMKGEMAQYMRQSREYQTYLAVAPEKEAFPRLLDKMGELLSRSYDWSAEVSAIQAPTLLLFGDHDSVMPAHMVRFFELLGGGKKDAGLDGSGMSKARLAILPGLTHYNVFESPALAESVRAFLGS